MLKFYMMIFFSLMLLSGRYAEYYSVVYYQFQDEINEINNNVAIIEQKISQIEFSRIFTNQYNALKNPYPYNPKR